MINPLVAQLTHQSLPELADALRVSVGAIHREWDAAVRQALPQLDVLTFNELKDSIPKILASIADALASPDPQQIQKLVEDAPVQGLTRFHQNYTVTEIMQEDRLLRALIVLHVEGRLGRQMNAPEAAALHATVDVMLQRAVVALVDQQKAQLRDAAERELKYLSFLSHDLNNNLSSITLRLNLLKRQLAASAESAHMLDEAQQSIRDTTEGMRRLLDHERLRKGGGTPNVRRVDLHAFVANLAQQFRREAEAKGLRVEAHAEPDAIALTDPELITLVARNVVGNAVKYGRGTVQVRAEKRDDAGGGGGRRWSLSVSDEGPGIPPDKLGTIFEAFRRGEVHGQEGVGLGLAIAAQAAKLLGAELTVESKLGVGSTFRLTFPPEASGGGTGSPSRAGRRRLR